MLVKEVQSRLKRLEQEKAKLEDFSFFGCFAGRDAQRVSTGDGRFWEREADEDFDAFMARIRAAYPPHGFLLVHRA